MLPINEIATHEAGHAITSEALGRGFRSVSIVPDDTTAGRVVQKRRKLEPERELVIAVAGQVAHRMANWDTLAPLTVQWDAKVDTDGKLAAACAFLLAGDDDAKAPKHMGRAVLKAIAILDASWEAVDELAAELLGRPELRRRDALPILREYANNGRSVDIARYASVFDCQGATFTVCVVRREAVTLGEDLDA